jgi:hypothetical protein
LHCYIEFSVETFARPTKSKKGADLINNLTCPFSPLILTHLGYEFNARSHYITGHIIYQNLMRFN